MQRLNEEEDVILPLQGLTGVAIRPTPSLRKRKKYITKNITCQARLMKLSSSKIIYP